MNREINENILTAYVLGELPEDQAATVRDAIATDPDLQRAVAEIEESAGLVRAGFEREKTHFGLTVRPPRWWSKSMIGIAASVVVGGMLAAVVVTHKSQPVQVAGNMQSNMNTMSNGAPTQPLGSQLATTSPAAPKQTIAEVFVAPSSNAEKDNYRAKELRKSDFNSVSQNLTYSYANPSPAPMATGKGYRLNNSLTPDFSVAADINPGDARKELSDKRTESVTTLNSTLALRGTSVPLDANAPPVPQSRSSRMYALGTAGRNVSKLKNVNDSIQLPADNEAFATVRIQEKVSNTESYSRIEENAFLAAAQNPLSTFSVDVDTASYANIRRFIESGQLPPKDAVRIEEMVNYFPYHYAPPTNDDAFATSIESADCPWAQGHRLVRIGIKGKEVSAENRPPMSLTFLIDVSGSMFEPNKLPLVKESLKMLVEKLRPIDRVGIVVYAGNTGLVLPTTQCSEKELILSKIDGLEAGGSTNGAAGIGLAYQTAQSAFIKNGVNRVILCTDGDWNVGVTSEGDLTRMIEEKAKSGVFLSVLGFGMGNLKDSMMVKLADKGNGNYGYVDTQREAKKLLVDQMSGTLVTIAKDVKIQVEFNPALVGSYRLIGYEKRMLAKEDFNDDKKDAGEIGAGHTVTALYEIAPPGADDARPAVDPLKYQGQGDDRRLSDITQAKEMLTVKVRYKQPDGDVSKKLEFPFKDEGKDFAHASKDMQFAAGVAEFGMVLRDSQYKGMSSMGSAMEIAHSAAGDDAYRREFVELEKKAAMLMSQGK